MAEPVRIFQVGSDYRVLAAPGRDVAVETRAGAFWAYGFPSMLSGVMAHELGAALTQAAAIAGAPEPETGATRATLADTEGSE